MVHERLYPPSWAKTFSWVSRAEAHLPFGEHLMWRGRYPKPVERALRWGRKAFGESVVAHLRRWCAAEGGEAL